MPGRYSRASAIVAVLALLVAVPLERSRGCDVCPADCPMHAAKRPDGGQHLGCHRGGSHPDRGAEHEVDCAMRATCGHHATATPVAFQAVLAPCVRVGLALVAEPVLAALRTTPTRDAPEPPTDPPRSPSV